MARIIYGVMGDSGGHISRSLAVAAEMPEHEFLFVGGDRVVEANDHGHAYLPFPMISTILKDNKVALLQTAAHFSRIILNRGSIVDDMCRVMDNFNPDLAITDYEFFLPRAANKCGVPCVSLDHQHVLTHCRYPSVPGETSSRMLTIEAVRHLFSGPDRFLVSSFFQLPPVDGNVAVIPPVIRRDILDLAVSDGDHVTVYLRSGVGDQLLDGLKSLNRDCRIYGMGAAPSHGNLTFLPSSREGFLKDLASSAYVICNGGHTLTSEALHLGKPVLAFPTSFFYEQYFNAYHLRKLGYGDFAVSLNNSATVMAGFEKGLDGFRANLTGIDLFGNEVAAEKIRSMVGA